MIEVLRIDHICLFVSDINRSKKYYDDIFGTISRVHPNDDKTYMFETPNIHFFIKEVNLPIECYGYQHLSFEVKSINDVLEILKAKTEIKYQTGQFNSFNYNNYKWLEWRDPDGIRLEVVERIPLLATISYC